MGLLGTGDRRAAELGTVLLPGRWWQRPWLCQPCKMEALCPPGGTGSCGRAGARPRAGGPWEAVGHRHWDRCWAGSEKLRLKPGESSRGSPWLSPGGMGSSPRGPPIAAGTGCFFALARWLPAPLPCAHTGLEWLLRSCEEQRELELARAASPPPQWALCVRPGEAESNYRQRGGRAAHTRLPKTPSPPARGPPEGPQDPATLLYKALF